EEREVPAYTIAHNSTLITIATLLPQSRKELLRINKVGPKTWDNYGKDLIRIVGDYIRKNNITPPLLTTAQTTGLGSNADFHH
ncbi:MAG: superfamily II DNA helicase RecQ, partial [Paraglaciecola sp.]